MVASLSLLNTNLGKQYCDAASDTATERKSDVLKILGGPPKTLPRNHIVHISKSAHRPSIRLVKHISEDPMAYRNIQGTDITSDRNVQERTLQVRVMKWGKSLLVRGMYKNL